MVSNLFLTFFTTVFKFDHWNN